MPSLVDLSLAKNKNKMFTVESDEPAKQGEGKARRHWLLKDKPLIDSLNPKIKTMYDNFKRGVDISGKFACPFYLWKRSYFSLYFQVINPTWGRDLLLMV